MTYYYTTFEPWKDSAGVAVSGVLGGEYDENGHRVGGAIIFKRQKINPTTKKFEKGQGTIAHRYVKPSNPQTGAQQTQRQKLTNAVSAWQALSNEEKSEWRQKAKKDSTRTGHNLFISRHINNN